MNEIVDGWMGGWMMKLFGPSLADGCMAAATLHASKWNDPHVDEIVGYWMDRCVGG